MALSERTIVDRVEVLVDGTVQVRQANQVLRDGVVISQTYHRNLIRIADPNPDLSWMDEATKSVVMAARTEERLLAAQERASQLNSSIAASSTDSV